MKNIFTLFAFITATTFISCKKDSEVQKPRFTDIEFSISDLRALGDTTTTEITYPNTIILKSDYTWTINLAGLKSNGTYSWTPFSDQQGDIRFTIIKWTDFTLDQSLSDKLKSSLQAVNSYGFPLQSTTCSFLGNNCQCGNFPFIRVNKK